MTDWGIIGHDWAVQRLSAAIARGQLAQSHLFVGPPSIGKAALARATTRALIGRDERARKLIDGGRHPDLSWVQPDGDSIKVDAMRELLHTLALAPVESTHRVAVIDQAHLITDSGKNAILKTLEEPNAKVVMILIAPSADAMLPTISSRCQVLNLRPAPFADMRQALIARGAAPERASFLARLARGRVGWALSALADESLLEARVERLDDMQRLLGGTSTERFAYAEKLARQDGARISVVLDEWMLFWRDVGQVIGGTYTQNLRNGDRLSIVLQVAQAVSATDVRAQMHALAHTEQLIEQNVNARLALDTLLLKMPRVLLT
jgi:DNA polymerase III subunit delta'